MATHKEHTVAVTSTISRKISAAEVGFVRSSPRRNAAVTAATAANAAARPRASDQPARRVSTSMAKVERDTGHDGVRLEQQRTLDEERPLIVKQMMPPARRNELRE